MQHIGHDGERCCQIQQGVPIQGSGIEALPDPLTYSIHQREQVSAVRHDPLLSLRRDRLSASAS